MKANRVFLILLCICMLAACGKTNPTDPNVSSMWDLGKRYDSDYSKISHVFHYVKQDTSFYLSVTRTKKLTNSLKGIKDSVTIGSDAYALCETNVPDSDGNRALLKTYDCMNGIYHYKICGSDLTTDISSVLTLQEAAALMQSPLSVPIDVTFLNEEWSAYYRTQTSNLEIYVFPSDSGKACSNATSEYEQRAENGESYLYSETDKAILYTDGINTVWIRQADRSGSGAALYSTLTECKAILALLGAN